MNIRKMKQEEIKKLINSKEFSEIYKTLDKESQKILKPYIKDRKIPIINKAKSLGKAIKEWVSHGMPEVTEKQYQRRLKICQGCEFWNNNTCKICGCTSAKLRLSTSKCPLSPPLWDREI